MQSQWSLLRPVSGMARREQLWLFRRVRCPGQIIWGELEGTCDFARDLLEIGCHRGTAIAVPYGYAVDKMPPRLSPGRLCLCLGYFVPIRRAETSDQSGEPKGLISPPA